MGQAKETERVVRGERAELSENCTGMWVRFLSCVKSFWQSLLPLSSLSCSRVSLSFSISLDLFCIFIAIHSHSH